MSFDFAKSKNAVAKSKKNCNEKSDIGFVIYDIDLYDGFAKMHENIFLFLYKNEA